MVLGLELQASLWECLIHASSPFCSGYLGDRIWTFAKADLDGNPAMLYFQSVLQLQSQDIMPGFYLLR
jgi:hypothetical protein